MSLTTNQGLIIPDPGDGADVPASVNELITGGATPASGLENRLVQRYVSAVDRGTRNPSPNEGELSYLSDTNVYESYSGSAWVPLLVPQAFDDDPTNVTGIVSTTYVTTGGPIVGATIIVPLSGQVRVDWSSNMDNSGTGLTLASPSLNAGNVVGSGAVLTGPQDAISTRMQGTDELQTSSFWVYTGLTPGAAVNAFLNHRVTTGTGVNNNRRLSLSQA